MKETLSPQCICLGGTGASVRPARGQPKGNSVLAPNNRYVLRSAARLHTHTGDPERANDILRHGKATNADPWLLATELSTANLAGKAQKHANVARKLLEARRHSPFELAELASSLATLDAHAADFKRARNFFRRSMAEPNENVVAQARWAATHNIFELPEGALNLPRVYEARAWQDFYNGDWSSALAAGEGWLNDQPFSVDPAVHSS